MSTRIGVFFRYQNMSVVLNQAGLILQPCAVDCRIRTINGTIATATQVGTYQINPLTGASELVAGSLKYLDSNGAEIPGASRADDAPALPPTRIWFSSANGSPIYYLDGKFYSANGDEYTGPTEGYASNSTSIAWPSKVEKCTVWAVIRNQYITLKKIETTTYEGSTNPTIVVSYFMDGQPVTYTGPTVDVLPEPVYEERSQIVRDGETSLKPALLPISGFSAVWQIPFPTVARPIPSAVLKDGLSVKISNAVHLQSEAPMGTVNPPDIAVYGDAVAEVSYRVRVSPDVAEGERAVQLLQSVAAPIVSSEMAT